MKTYDESWWCVKQKKHMALVFITITMILQFQVKRCEGCLETERIGLLQLKSYLNSLLPSPHEVWNFETWSDDDPKSDCCLWERVKCNDTIGGHIVHLSLNQILPGKDLDAPLSLNLSLLHSFPQLQNLNFSLNGFNHLFDPIHELANMIKLKVLNLQWNQFSSFSVQGLINLKELEVLDLSGNNINDSEAGEGLRTTKLETLDLSHNSLSVAARLKGLEHLVELKVLSLAGNKFNHTRSIEVLKDMPKLRELDLTENKFIDLDSLGVALPSSLQVLDLRRNQLLSTPKGYSKICALVNLRELDLSINALTSMPYCLGILSRLRTLDLSENQLNGNLSSFVYVLPPTLEYLSLLGNNFNGSFRFNSLVNYTKLTVFKLSSKVGMVQALAESPWVPLFQLKMLKLQNFIFGSTIPGFLVHQHDLCYADLSLNKLTGAVPAWLVENNTRLQILFLDSNSLTELQLPRFVHGLQVLDISSNRIQDLIQEDIGIVFPNLRYLNFSSNRFYGTIPSSMGEMKNLETLDVSSNILYGMLPETFLRSCYSLKFLKLSNNQFQGQIFPVHANLTGLEWLALDGNSFNGSLGKGLLNSKNLLILDISDNSISGLPLWIGRMSSLWHLYMRGNQLKGPFPHQLQNLQQLMVIDLSHNSFSGSIPRNLDFPLLRVLSLGSNEFMGTISDTLFKAENLLVLDLRNNNFSGMILNTIGGRSNLRVLLMRNNNLQSHIPQKICQLSKVGFLDSSLNKFKGTIPSCLGNMLFGTERYYRITFPTPSLSITPLQTWSYRSYLNLYDELRSGYTPTPTTTKDFLRTGRFGGSDFIFNLFVLDFSSNQLSGEIPIQIGDLENIDILNFSGNYLTGSIPDSISKLMDLESLDLSSNKLDGNIPPELTDLDSLVLFNVSFNNLSGDIPIKGQFRTFEERSYIGNAHLCGPPTNKICNSERVQEQSEEEEFMLCIYWTCGAVYIITLLALSAFLSIDSHWSREWFYRVDLSVYHLQRFKGRFISN